MKIAVTYENGQIFQHFGHSEQLKIYDIADGKIENAVVVSTCGQGHSALVDLLDFYKIDVLICGGIGGGAKNALENAGIKLFGGVSGNADAAVNAFIAGTLDFNPDIKCAHHDHAHGESHSCGNHCH